MLRNKLKVNPTNLWKNRFGKVRMAPEIQEWVNREELDCNHCCWYSIQSAAAHLQMGIDCVFFSVLWNSWESMGWLWWSCNSEMPLVAVVYLSWFITFNWEIYLPSNILLAWYLIVHWLHEPDLALNSKPHSFNRVLLEMNFPLGAKSGTLVK